VNDENSLTTKKPNSRRKWIGCLIFAVFGVLGLISLPVVLGPWPHPPLWQIERISSISFPSSARVLNSHGRWFMEISVWAKIEMDKSDMGSFISSLPASGVSSHHCQTPSLTNELSGTWWDPETAKQTVYYESRAAGGNSTRNTVILILARNAADPRKVVVILSIVSSSSELPSVLAGIC